MINLRKDCTRIDPRSKHCKDSDPSDTWIVRCCYRQGGSWEIGFKSEEHATRMRNHWIDLGEKDKNSGIVVVQVIAMVSVRKVEYTWEHTAIK